MSSQIQEHKGLYIFESIVFILLGILAIAVPYLFTYSIELLIGFVFLIGGIVQIFRAFKSQSGGGLVGTLITSVISIILGILLLAYPITGIITLTLLIAAFFFIEGIVQLYLGFKMKDLPGWGWVVFSGLVSIFLALLIWSEFPGSAAWVIGLLVGINMLIFGFSQLFLVTNTPKGA